MSDALSEVLYQTPDAVMVLGFVFGLTSGWMYCRWMLRHVDANAWARVSMGLGATAIAGIAPTVLTIMYFLIRFRSLRDADVILPFTIMFFCPPAMLGTAISASITLIRSRSARNH